MRQARCGLLLIAVTLAVYFPAAKGGFFWDDESYILENQAVQAPDGVPRIWLDPAALPQYYPLVFTSFWIEHRLWQLDPRGYHVTNILLHALNVLLLWTVLRRLAIPGAFLAAAIFAVHPVHAESVAWITERKDVLSTSFYLLSVLAWLRFLDTRHWSAYAATGLLFVCAMLSKTIACTLPVTLALLTWWKHRERVRLGLTLLTPFVLLSIGSGLITIWREHVAVYDDIIVAPLSPIERVIVAARALWFYLGKLVWPVDLMPVYPRWHIDVSSPWQLMVVIAAAALVVVPWSLRARVGVGPFVAMTFFVVTLTPVLGIIPFGFLRLSFVADHFQYLASAGPIALAAAGATLVSERWRAGPGVLTAVSSVLLLALGILTWRQARLYEDAVVLWRDNLTKNPTAATVHSNLGALLQRRGDLPDAIRYLTEAVRLHPEHAQAQYNLGTALSKSGDTEGAIEHLQASLRVKPDFAPAHYNLGTILMRPGTVDVALEHFETAVRIKPDYAEAYYNLGIIHSAQGKFDDSIQEFSEAIRAKPDYPEAYNNRGAVRYRVGDVAGALDDYRTAIRIKPDHTRAYYNVGLALAAQGKLDEGVEALRAAARIDPKYADARRELATLLEMQGKIDAAIAEYNAALLLQPGDVRAQQGLQRAIATR